MKLLPIRSMLIDEKINESTKRILGVKVDRGIIK